MGGYTPLEWATFAACRCRGRFGRTGGTWGFVLDAARTVEQGAPDAFFDRPTYERMRHFLSQILGH